LESDKAQNILIMKNIVKITGLAIAGTLILASCKKDDMEPTTNDPVAMNKTISTNITGLEDLGTDYVYEGWIIVNGAPVSTGTFTVDANGVMSASSFSVSEADALAATDFVLTIEPAVDPDPAPSATKLLGGPIANNSGILSISHIAALGNNFTTSTGDYTLATPTDGMGNNELSGIWFLDPNGAPDPSLNLPTLPSGWAYEGWVVINGIPVSTGTFTDVAAADDAAPFSGAMSAPPFPGEDFLQNAPTGLTFPTDISGSTVVISIEPVPDNSAAPFLLKPLVGMTPGTASPGILYSMGLNTSSFPTGTITIQ